MLTVYTDGSCHPKNPGKGGWAFVALTDKGEVKNSGGLEFTTNNIMEITAVLEVLKTFKDETVFKIFSDSQYVINCAQKKWKRNKNIELWKEYDALAKGKNVEFQWVRSHQGDRYNEMVDKMAKNAC